MSADPAPVLEKARVLGRLGFGNVLRVGAYRALLRAGVYRRLLPPRAALSGPFFEWPQQGEHGSQPTGVDAIPWVVDAERVMLGELPAFSNGWVPLGFPPRWQRSVLSGVDFEEPLRHWTLIPDFRLPGGDVKGYWEAARFDGLVILALGWIATRREDMQRAVEAWLSSWCAGNPANLGVQWKCGQETGIRLMHLLLAAELLRRWGGVRTTANFEALVEEHCARIAPTMLYAVAQDNNHGTSEAAALFAGGVYLAGRGGGPRTRRGAAWGRLGRRWLENRLARLVMADGSFSQHSVNYHRMMLDTCSFAEAWRRLDPAPPFSETFYDRCRAATRWLASVTDSASGDAPNLGANDGTRLLALHRLPYRDHRSSVQLASVLFLGAPAYPAGPHDEPLSWLEIEAGSPPLSRENSARLFPEGGYAKLVAEGAWLLMRIPRFRFRPSHADALHVDLWVGGKNVLRDGGTYSYNAGDEWLRYFTGPASHNTVQFDDRDPMPRLSRFLFGRWLEYSELDFSEERSHVTAAYRDHRGATHRRSVQLWPGQCKVTDTIDGFSTRAVLRWRLAPELQPMASDDGWWTAGPLRIRVRSALTPTRVEWVEGWEARHYGTMTSVPVLEVEVPAACTVTTELSWAT